MCVLQVLFLVLPKRLLPEERYTACHSRIVLENENRTITLPFFWARHDFLSSRINVS